MRTCVRTQLHYLRRHLTNINRIINIINQSSKYIRVVAKMQNVALVEMLALEKFKENLKVAQQERLIASALRDSPRPVWKKLLAWAFPEARQDRKPARA